jgi:hypothetical protein
LALGSPFGLQFGSVHKVDSPKPSVRCAIEMTQLSSSRIAIGFSQGQLTVHGIAELNGHCLQAVEDFVNESSNKLFGERWPTFL